MTTCGLKEPLNGWEAGKVKDTASKGVCKWILSMALLLNRDSELAQELRGGDLREGEDQRHVLTPGAPLGFYTDIFTPAHTASPSESYRGCCYMLIMPISLCRSIAILMCLHLSPVPKSIDTPPPTSPYLRCRKQPTHAAPYQLNSPGSSIPIVKLPGREK